MPRVFYDSGERVVVSETGPGSLLLKVGETEVELYTEALAQRVLDAIKQGLAGLQSKDARD